MKTTLESIFLSVGIDLGVNHLRLQRVITSEAGVLTEEKKQELSRLCRLFQVANSSLVRLRSELTEEEKAIFL